MFARCSRQRERLSWLHGPQSKAAAWSSHDFGKYARARRASVTSRAPPTCQLGLGGSRSKRFNDSAAMNSGSPKTTATCPHNVSDPLFSRLEQARITSTQQGGVPQDCRVFVDGPALELGVLL